MKFGFWNKRITLTLIRTASSSLRRCAAQKEDGFFPTIRLPWYTALLFLFSYLDTDSREKGKESLHHIQWFNVLTVPVGMSRPVSVSRQNHSSPTDYKYILDTLKMYYKCNSKCTIDLIFWQDWDIFFFSKLKKKSKNLIRSRVTLNDRWPINIIIY